MISVQVVIMGAEGNIFSGSGRIDPSQGMHFIKTDIVEGLGRRDVQLGEPNDWKIAVAPANEQTPLERYRPAEGDTIILLRNDVGRSPAAEITG